MTKQAGICGKQWQSGLKQNLNILENQSMQRSESVGSVTSALAKMNLYQPATYDELKTENESLKDQLQHQQETNDMLLHDAARWNFAKKTMFAKLGFEDPKQMEQEINKQMDKEFLKETYGNN